jgi:hypothetical protein
MNYLKYLPVALLALSFSSSLTAGNPQSIKGTDPVKGITRATDIISFNAISDGKKVYVNWASGNEKKYDYYTVEKAKDGLHFETASMIKSGGNTNTIIDYIDIDYSPYSGISYYRLKQTDYSGEISYSDVVRVNYQFSKDGTVVSCHDIDPIDLSEIDKKDILVVVMDDKGNEFVSKVILNSQDGTLYATDTRNRLSKGSYRVLASSYNRLFSQNLIIR